MILCDKDNKHSTLKLTKTERLKVLELDQQTLSKIHRSNQWVACDCSHSKQPLLTVVKSQKDLFFLRSLPGSQSHHPECPLAYAHSSQGEAKTSIQSFQFIKGNKEHNQKNLKLLTNLILAKSTINSIGKFARQFNELTPSILAASENFEINDAPLLSCLSLTKGKYLQLINNLQSLSRSGKEAYGISVIYLKSFPREGFKVENKTTNGCYIKFENVTGPISGWTGETLVFSLVEEVRKNFFAITNSYYIPISDSDSFYACHSEIDDTVSGVFQNLINETDSTKNVSIVKHSERIIANRGCQYEIRMECKPVCGVQLTGGNHDLDQTLPVYPLNIAPTMEMDKAESILQDKKDKIARFIRKFINKP